MRSFFCPKKPSVFRKCGVYLPSVNAEDEITKKNNKKKIVGSTTRTRDRNFAVHRSNRYSIPPSLDSEHKIAYIKKLKIFLFELEKILYNNICRYH